MKIRVIGEISEGEIEKYRELAYSKFPHNKITELVLEVDGDFVNIDYYLSAPQFERVRRITGYLTTLKRMNNAKSAEVSDRLSHGF